MKTEELKNEAEVLSEEDVKLRGMLDSLKRVEAPKDFDFRLKARIADRKAGNFQPRVAWAFRFVLPIFAVIVLLLTILAYNGGFWFSGENPQSAENQVSPENNLAAVENSPTPNDSSDANITVPNQDLPKNNESRVAQSNRKNSTTERRPEEKKDNFKGGSKDFGFKQFIPKQPDFNSNIAPQKPNLEIPNPISVQSILSQIGINTISENGKLTVKSVTSNSFAERSGVKEADIIEAIDSQTISPDSTFVKTFSGKTITVSRNGKKVQIKLQNK